MIKVISNQGSSGHVSLDTVNEFVKEIVSSSNDNIEVINNSDILTKIANRVYNTSRKLKITNLFVPEKKHQRKNNAVYIAILMGAGFKSMFT